MSAESFERTFLQHKNDPTRWSEPLFDVLDGVFADVDDYSAERARGAGRSHVRSESGSMRATYKQPCPPR